MSSNKEFIEDNIIETDYANCVVNKNTRRSEKKKCLRTKLKMTNFSGDSAALESERISLLNSFPLSP